jgi:large subunit ribosomal protein L10
MPKADKVATVAEITDKFRSSSAAVVTEYRGLTMAQLTELRRSLGKDTAYTVAKNTLVKRAAADAGVTGLDDMFVGPTAVAFIGGEPVDAAKALRDFAKTHPLLVIKGGLLDGRKIEPAEVSKLADLESRDVLLAKMAGAMLATLTKAAYVFNALPSQVARLAAALQDKRIADGEVLEAAPAAEAADDAAVVAAAEAVVAEEADEVAKEIITAEGAAAEAAEAAVEAAQVEAEVEAVEEIAVAEVIAEEAVAVELAEEIAVIEEVAEEAIAEAPDEAAAEEVLAEAAVAEVVAIEAAAEDIEVIEAVAEELAEEVLAEGTEPVTQEQAEQA